ncbi:MAG: hypothetical protein ACXWJK_03140, partial [Burkholderiaceae bacterium]
EFLAGMQNIERDIITKLRDIGVQITAANFQWNRGKDFVPPPEAISLEIKGQGNSTNAILSREQIEDSCQRIDRPDVTALVKGCVADLAK